MRTKPSTSTKGKHPQSCITGIVFAAGYVTESSSWHLQTVTKAEGYRGPRQRAHRAGKSCSAIRGQANQTRSAINPNSSWQTVPRFGVKPTILYASTPTHRGGKLTILLATILAESSFHWSIFDSTLTGSRESLSSSKASFTACTFPMPENTSCVDFPYLHVGDNHWKRPRHVEATPAAGRHKMKGFAIGERF